MPICIASIIIFICVFTTSDRLMLANSRSPRHHVQSHKVVRPPKFNRLVIHDSSSDDEVFRSPGEQQTPSHVLEVSKWF